MTPLRKLTLAIAAAERDPDGGKVVLDLDTARALTGAHTQRELGADALLPCPFCGGEVAPNARNGMTWVYCRTCTCATCMYPDLGAAADAWNRRAPVTQPVAQEPVVQCCMCGKKDLSTDEDGGPECELHDGRWVCSSDCWDRAATPAPVDAGRIAGILEAAAHLMAIHRHHPHMQHDAAAANIMALTDLPFTAGLGVDRLEAVVAALRAQSAPVAGPSQAALDVLAERQRQISAEGWTLEHDDRHRRGALAGAAVCYALNGFAGPIGPGSDDFTAFWPWADEWWKPTDRRRDLVKSGALILAEIERIDRAAPVAGEGGEE